MSFRVRPHVVLLWVLGGVLALLGVMLAVPAYAATFGELEPAAGTWRVYRGSGFTTFVCQATSEAGAKACAATDAEARRTTTRYQIRYPNRYGTATYTAQAPVNCVVSAWSAWTGGEWSACTNGSQTRQETRTRTIVTQPANGGTACPALTETRAATQACTVEPPTGDWVRCATQGQRCEFTGTRLVRYGLEGRGWTEREFTDGVMCDRTGFGTNPVPDALKVCDMRGAAAPPPPPPETGTGTALLDWRNPSQNIDDTPLGTIVATRIYYGRDQSNLDRSAQVDGAGSTYTVTGLPSGSWFFQVSTVSQSGESAQSNVATKVIP